MRTLILLATLTITAGIANAAGEDQGSSVEYVISGTSGGYEVTVSPDFVTVVYLPEEVTQAFASDQRNFVISIKRNTVAVRPLKMPLTANLNIDTKTLHIGMVLRTGPSEKARTQVIFRTEEESRRFEAEVQRRLAPIREEYEDRLATQTERRVAERLLHRFQARTLDGVARSDSHVVLRAMRGIWIGDEVYLVVRVQNQSSRDYVVAMLQAYLANQPVKTTAVFQPPGPDASAVGLVPANHDGMGILVIPAAKLTPGGTVEIRLTGATGDVVRLEKVRYE